MNIIDIINISISHSVENMAHTVENKTPRFYWTDLQSHIKDIDIDIINALRICSYALKTFFNIIQCVIYCLETILKK